MKIRGYLYDGLALALALVTALGFAVYSLISGGDIKLFLAEMTAVAAVLIIVLARMLFSKRRFRRMLKAAVRKLDLSDRRVLDSLPFPACVTGEDGTVAWGNSLFADGICGGDLDQDFSLTPYLESGSGETPCVRIGENYYTVFHVDCYRDGENYRAYGFIDSTELKKTEDEFNRTRPYALIIEVDNIDDYRSDFRESEKSTIKSLIEAMIEEWSEKFGSAAHRISEDRYYIITEKENTDAMTRDGFSIVDDVRKFSYKEKNAGVTLSVGVASGKSIISAQANARKAFDMALGRGGDQVAFRNPDGTFKFYGEASGSAEKYSNTRTRMLAKTLAEDIENSSGLLIMGHANSDFDAVGAAVGIAALARDRKVPAFIVTDPARSLAVPLINMMKDSGLGDWFISLEQAEKMINRRTMLVLTDTHLASLSEFPELFAKCEKRVIVDHHRLVAGKLTDEKPVHHYPNASSTCEIVADYLACTVDDSAVSAPVAKALLSGIMLDTKNFILRSGAGTFEAAAYLRQRGANPVEVRRLFTESAEMNSVKNSVVSRAKFYKDCAVSSVPPGTPDSRLAAAKAADELLNISGVKASFVMYGGEDETFISARSFGDINVQLAMEAIGGGGHKTMAAVKLDKAMEESEKMLFEVIDKITAKEKQ